jgi:hypothetical protein
MAAASVASVLSRAGSLAIHPAKVASPCIDPAYGRIISSGPVIRSRLRNLDQQNICSLAARLLKTDRCCCVGVARGSLLFVCVRASDAMSNIAKRVTNRLAYLESGYILSTCAKPVVVFNNDRATSARMGSIHVLGCFSNNRDGNGPHSP